MIHLDPLHLEQTLLSSMDLFLNMLGSYIEIMTGLTFSPRVRRVGIYVLFFPLDTYLLLLVAHHFPYVGVLPFLLGRGMGGYRLRKSLQTFKSRRLKLSSHPSSKAEEPCLSLLSSRKTPYGAFAR